MVNKNTFLDYLDLYKNLNYEEKEINISILNNLDLGEYEEALLNISKLKLVREKIKLIEKMEMKYHNQN